MEEYIQVLLEQIRCKKAQPYIREEVCGHLEEQIEDNIAAGMSRVDAEKAAVLTNSRIMIAIKSPSQGDNESEVLILVTKEELDSFGTGGGF